MATTIEYDDGRTIAVCSKCGIHQPPKETTNGDCSPDCEARRQRTGGVWTVTKDTHEVFRGSEMACMAYLHDIQPNSINYAIWWDGYSIQREGLADEALALSSFGLDPVANLSTEPEAVGVIVDDVLRQEWERLAAGEPPQGPGE